MSQIRFIQVKEASNPSTTQINTSINATAGNILVVAVGQGSSNSPIPTVSDTTGINFNFVEKLYNQSGNGVPGGTGPANSPYQLSLGIGVVPTTGLDIITARQQPPLLQNQFVTNSQMFLSVAEYSGVFTSGSNVILDQIDGRQIPSIGPFAEVLPIQPTSWIACAAIMLGANDFSGPGTGSLRINDIQGTGITSARFIYLDNTFGIISANEGSAAFAWFIASFGLPSAPPPPPPIQRPAAIFKTPVVSYINRNQMDRLYPYKTLQVTPTNLKPLPFVCPHCRAPGSATIYRDVREYAVSVGIPDIRYGGMPKGQSFDFIYCGACLRWYRKNDYKQVVAPAIVDIGISSRLNPTEDIGMGPPDEPEYFSTQENLASDSVRIALQSNLNGFVDDGFERTGFVVQTIPTGSIEPS